MFTISNLLSVSRLFLALLFIIDNTPLRLIILFAVMATDYLDGFLARRSGKTTQLGAALDPLMDKIFVFVALGILIGEGNLKLWEGLALISRDVFLLLFACYLALTHRWGTCRFHSLWWGKLISLAQYFILVLLVLSFDLSVWLYIIFLGLGLLYLGELFLFMRENQNDDAS